MDDREDLRRARELGLFLLRVRGLDGGAQLEGGVLRYDPELDDAERAPAVFSLLAGVGPRAAQASRVRQRTVSAD